MERQYKNMLNLLRLISIILITMMGIAGVNIIPASATHEKDHRYTVHGHVYDDQGVPSSRTLVVIKDKTGLVLKTAKTGFDGSYKILLHLHNKDLGKELIIAANNIEKKLKVTFNPSDAKTDRLAKVNFGPSQEAGKGLNLPIILGAIFFVVLAIGAYFVYSGRKKKQEQQQQNKTVKKQKPKKGKTKKKKR